MVYLSDQRRLHRHFPHRSHRVAPCSVNAFLLDSRQQVPQRQDPYMPSFGSETRIDFCSSTCAGIAGRKMWTHFRANCFNQYCRRKLKTSSRLSAHCLSSPRLRYMGRLHGLHVSRLSPTSRLLNRYIAPCPLGGIEEGSSVPSFPFHHHHHYLRTVTTDAFPPADR